MTQYPFPNKFVLRWQEWFKDELKNQGITIDVRAVLDFGFSYDLSLGDYHIAYAIDEIFMILERDLEGNARWLAKSLAMQLNDAVKAGTIARNSLHDA